MELKRTRIAGRAYSAAVLAARWIPLTVAISACTQSSAPPACDPDACAANGQVCDDDACTDPWRVGSPVWSTCAADPRATPESLAAKAAAYDARAMALHVAP